MAVLFGEYRMEEGRKRQNTFVLEALSPWADGSNAPGRNLQKSGLGGMIFTCTNYNILDCLVKRQIVLPDQHASCIENMKFGLPLFLYNISDRRLHGLFEVTSFGKLGIDLSGGSDCTPCPIQVKFNILQRAQPLRGDQYDPILPTLFHILKQNYCFLNEKETQELIWLFAPILGSTTLVKLDQRRGVALSSSAQAIPSGVILRSAFLEGSKDKKCPLRISPV